MTSQVRQTSRTEQVAALLDEAAQRIETALILLDMRESNCPTCNSRRFHNLAHARVYQQYTDTPRRLKDSAARLRGKNDG